VWLLSSCWSVPPLRDEGRHTAREACGMVADVWWPFRSGGEFEGGGRAATLSSCQSVNRENEVV
jgi:hypothetical protein